MHQSSDEFKFKSDPITDYRVTCPWASEKSMYNVVNTLALSFLIGSSSFLQVTRTTIKSRMSSKFSQIQPWTAELCFCSERFPLPLGAWDGLRYFIVALP